MAQLAKPAMVLLAVAVFAGLSYTPKHATRPESKPVPVSPARIEATAPGLLMDDPLSIAYGWYYPDSELAPNEPERIAEKIERWPPGRTLVLGVSIRGGERAEDRETRARERQAVVFALIAESRYSARDPRGCRLITVGPDKPEKAADEPKKGDLADAAATGAGVTRSGPSNDSANDATGGSPDDTTNETKNETKKTWVVPYEWFDKNEHTGNEGKYSHVLVLWLDEDALDEAPLQKIEDVIASLPAAPSEDRVEVRIVGPSTTDSLIKLLDDASTSRSEPPRKERLHFISPYATAPLRHPRLRRVEALDNDPTQDPRMRLERTIGQDDALAWLLVWELSQRIPDLMTLETPVRSKDEPALLQEHAWLRWTCRILRCPAIHFLPKRQERIRVALVAQQDTGYGRFWMQSMEEARRAEAKRNPWLERLEFELVPFVGAIDGRPDGSAKGASADAVYPMGASQVDYLQRLEAELARRRFAAIGVFATDVYDTLTVLESLRSRFRDVPFFTVDLDARLLGQQHAPYTRNLVVATHLPLGRTGETLQFRDLYQYSVYRSVETLLKADAPLAVEGPRLYEIGLGRAVELNVPPGHPCPLGCACPPGRERPPGSIPWRRGPGAEPPTWLLILGAVAMAGFLAFFAWPPRPRTDRGRGLAWIPWLVGGVTLFAAVIGLGLLAETVSRDHAIEPLEIDAGVSAWPAVILRLVAAVVALVSFVAIPLRLRAASLAIGRKYLGFEEERVLPWRERLRWWDRLKQRLKGAVETLKGVPERLKAVFKSSNGAEESKDVEESARLAEPRERAVPPQLAELWKTTVKWTGNWRRHVGLGVAFVVLCHFSIGPYYGLQPMPAPVRGELAVIVERASVAAGVWAFFFLMSLVLRVSWSGCRLIPRIADERAAWPPRSLRNEQLETRLMESAADRRLRLALIAEVTREIERVVYYPAAVVTLLIAARASVFDSWSWPVVLVATLTLFFLLMLHCSINIRRVARHERARAIEFFREQELRYADQDELGKRLTMAREEIERLRGGAFSSLFEHPLVHSALLPLVAWLTTMSSEPRLLGSLLAGF